MSRLSRHLVLAIVVAGAPLPAIAAETKTYRYDAQGRLIQVKATSTTAPANGSTRTYSYDRAHNRLVERVVRGPPSP